MCADKIFQAGFMSEELFLQVSRLGLLCLLEMRANKLAGGGAASRDGLDLPYRDFDDASGEGVIF